MALGSLWWNGPQCPGLTLAWWHGGISPGSSGTQAPGPALFLSFRHLLRSLGFTAVGFNKAHWPKNCEAGHAPDSLRRRVRAAEPQAPRLWVSRPGDSAHSQAGTLIQGSNRPLASAPAPPTSPRPADPQSRIRQ